MNGFRPAFVVEPQRGVTLVELLVALVMGLVLLAGVATVFLANKETYRSQEALARVQENGRFALALLTHDLRFGGHRGCTSLRPAGDIANLVNWGTGTLPPATSRFADFARFVNASDFQSLGSWLPALDNWFTAAPTSPSPSIRPPFQPCGSNPNPAGCPTTAPLGSDVLMVRATSGAPARVLSHENPTDPLQVRGLLGLASANDLLGRLVMVSDCEAAAVFRVTSTAAASTSGPDDIALVHGVDLRKQYPSAGTAAEVQLVHNWAFYVAPNASGELSLWRWDGVRPAEEMVEGVERLEVTFGRDANADQEVDDYVPVDATNANDEDFWREVISVRIVVWVRSGLGVIPTNLPQQLDVDINLDGDTTDTGESASFTDGRLRQVFTATVALRNRLS